MPSDNLPPSVFESEDTGTVLDRDEDESYYIEAHVVSTSSNQTPQTRTYSNEIGHYRIPADTDEKLAATFDSLFAELESKRNVVGGLSRPVNEGLELVVETVDDPIDTTVDDVEHNSAMYYVSAEDELIEEFDSAFESLVA